MADNSLGGEAGPGCDVEHPLAGFQVRCAEQDRYGPKRHFADGPVISCRCNVAELKFGHGFLPWSYRLTRLFETAAEQDSYLDSDGAISGGGALQFLPDFLTYCLPQFI